MKSNQLSGIDSSKQSLVSIGLPVYNGAATLDRVLRCLVDQSYPNIEIIISDNASTDETPSICKQYVDKYGSIVYHRQDYNIGGAKNFQFVLNQSNGKYFHWAAADDIKSKDFISECVSLLEGSSSIVAVAPRDQLANFLAYDPLIRCRDFEIRGRLFSRIKTFLKYSFESNGIFYSLMNASVAKKFDFSDFNGLGADWTFIMFIISHGEVLRTKSAYAILGSSGLSNSNQRWSAFRTSLIHWLAPFYSFSIFVFKIIQILPARERLDILRELLNLNVNAAIMQMRFECNLFRVYIKQMYFK